jgi:hypothetical protein
MTYFNWINPVVYQVPVSFVVPVNFGLFILGNLWKAGLAIDALRMKNILQLYSICLLDISLFVFSVMRYFQTRKVAANLLLGEAPGPQYFTDRSVDYWATARPALLSSTTALGVCVVLSSVMVYLLQRELRWAIYRHISGSLEMLRRYLAYQVRFSLSQTGHQAHQPAGPSCSSSHRTLFLDCIRRYLWADQRALRGARIRPHHGPRTCASDPSSHDHCFHKSRKRRGCSCSDSELHFTLQYVLIQKRALTTPPKILQLGEMAYLITRILLLKGDPWYSNTALLDEQLLFASVALGLASLACITAGVCVFNFNKGLKPLLHRDSWKESPHEFEPIHEHRYAERIELD